LPLIWASGNEWDNDMKLLCATLFFVTALTTTARAQSASSGQQVPGAAVAAANEFFDSLQVACSEDPMFCEQKYELLNAKELKQAHLNEPWAAFVLSFDDFKNTPFQDLMKAARFNYFAFPIEYEGRFKGLIKICHDSEGTDEQWFNCGVRGPTRVAESNTYNLTLAPESDSLSVFCVLTVENNSRYIVVLKGSEFKAIPASDVACEMIGVHVRHVDKMTMYPLAEVLFKIDRKIKQRDNFKQ
jgi:hypothetical protein